MLIYLAFYFIGIILLVKSDVYFILFINIYAVISPIVIVKLAPRAYQFNGHVLVILLITLLFSSIFKRSAENHAERYFLAILFIIFVFIINVLISSLVTQNNLGNYIEYFKNYYWTWIIFYAALKTGKEIRLAPWFNRIIFLQVLIGIIQYAGPIELSRWFSIIEFEKDGAIVQRVSASIADTDAKLVVGTFGKITLLADYLSAFLAYYLGRMIIKRQKIRIVNYVFIGGILATIFFTGVRTALVAFLVGMIVTFIIIKNYKTIIFILTCILFYVTVFPALARIGNEIIVERKAGSVVNPFLRSVAVFGVIDNVTRLNMDNSLTLKRSIYISKFITWDTFLWGNGIMQRGGYEEGISSPSDAQILFIIAEYGAIAFILVLAPYILALWRVSRCGDRANTSVLLVSFIAILVHTVTDPGLFWNVEGIMFFSIAGSMLIKKKALNSARKPVLQ